MEIIEGQFAKVENFKNDVHVDNPDYLYRVYDNHVDKGELLLGRVLILKKDGNATSERFPINIKGFKKVITKDQRPVKRRSLIVDKKFTTHIGVLNYLSGEITETDALQILVFDQQRGHIEEDEKFDIALKNWIEKNAHHFTDDSIISVSVVMSFIQKNILRKKYTSTKVKGSFGLYGFKAGGSYYTSQDEFELDVIFGLELCNIKMLFGKNIEHTLGTRTEIATEVEQITKSRFIII